MSLFAFIICFPVLVQGQSGFDDDTLDNPVPFDGGVTLLIAAIVGYGLKKANGKRKADNL